MSTDTITTAARRLTRQVNRYRHQAMRHSGWLHVDADGNVCDYTCDYGTRWSSTWPQDTAILRLRAPRTAMTHAEAQAFLDTHAA